MLSAGRAIHSYLYLLNSPMMMLPAELELEMMTCNLLLLLLRHSESLFVVVGVVALYERPEKSHILWDARCSVNGVSTA